MVVAVGGALAACAQVLDIPNDLHVADGPTSVRQLPDQNTPAMSSAQDVTPLTPVPEVPDASTPDLPDATEHPTQPGGHVDAAPANVADAAADALDAGVTAPDAAPPTPSCGAAQSLGPDGHCYATVATALSWLDARVSCRALGDGWDLASIRSEEVNVFLTGVVSEEAWIGGTDRAAEGTWVWINDRVSFWVGSADAGSPVEGAYVNWHPTEPNGVNDSDCARIVPELANIWADLPCAELRSAVCEGPRLSHPN